MFHVETDFGIQLDSFLITEFWIQSILNNIL